jgi:O-antigen/teichoic acid export membrane protein
MGPVAALYAGTLMVKTALDALLIPRYGPVGAAAAMALAETSLAGGILLVLRRAAGVAPSGRALAAAAGAALLIPAARLLDDPTGGFVVAGGYLLVVAAWYALTDVVHPHERRVIGKALRERRVATEAS